MPLPLAPLLPIAMRIGLVTATGFAIRRFVVSRLQAGRTDQRAEDALDDLGDGLALHQPADRAEDQQTNAAGRMRRVIRMRGQTYEIDAGFLARFRIRKG
jgi:hypothetical protein